MTYLETIKVASWLQHPLFTGVARPDDPSGHDSMLGTLGAAGTAAGIGAGAHQAASDFEQIGQRLNDWQSGVASAVGKDALPTLANANRAVNAYAQGGRQVIQSKVLGMPVAHWMMQASVPFQGGDMKGPGAYLQYLRQKLTGDQNASLPAGNLGRHQHYGKFADPGTSLDELKTYMQRFHFNEDSVNEMGKGVLHETGLTLSQRLGKLRGVDPQGYQAFRAHIPHLVNVLGGEAGERGIVGGTSDLYRSLMTPKIYDMVGRLRGLRNVALPAAGMIAGADLYNHFTGHQPLGTPDLFKSASQQPDDQLNWRGAIPAAASIPLGLSGINDLRRPLDIGVSYGTMPGVGAGHKTPAKTITGMLQDLQGHAKAPSFNLHDLRRDTSGWVDPTISQRSYDGLVDTGWGSYSPRGWGSDLKPFNRNSGTTAPETPIKVRPGGFFGVQTDLGDLGMPGNSAANVRYNNMQFSPKEWGARMMGFPDTFASYDPNPEALKQHPLLQRMQLLHTGNHGFPTVTPDALDTLKDLRGTNRQSLIHEVLNDPGVQMPDHVRSQLANLGDKRLLAITGSGRGDQAAFRALEMQKKLEGAGLQDKWHIMTMLGDSAQRTPFAAQAAAHPNIISFGKMPQRYYVGLPGHADYHMASSGTSALMEALGTGAHLNFHPDQNNWKEQELKQLGNFDYHTDPQTGSWSLKNQQPFEHAWKGTGFENPAGAMQGIQSVDLDSWNRSNKQFAWKFPGVTNAQTSDDVINHLKDESLFSPEAIVARGARADHMLGSHAMAGKNLENGLLEWLQKRRGFANLTGAGKLLGAGGLAATGLMMARSQGPTQVVNPLQNGAGYYPAIQNALSFMNPFQKHASTAFQSTMRGGGPHSGRLGLALTLAGLAAGGGYAALNHKGNQPAPDEQPQMPPMTNNGHLTLASLLGGATAGGGALGGIGAALNGQNPLRGAATGIGTGLGAGAGVMGGEALADGMGIQNPLGRLAMVGGGAGLGGFVGNRIAGGLFGNKPRHRSYEDE